ncbi:MAG: class I SAM-dependent methyltransferase [Candidatus Latescibacterota bacterium]|jgi:caffeoyl-CoA O-methyltransferase
MLSFLPEDLELYVASHCTPESPVLEQLAADTRENTDQPQMMVNRAEALLLRALVRASGARRILEIGTFTGYSALSMAEALPEDGTVITCDIDPETTSIARRYWGKSPHGSKIELRLGPALESIPRIDGTFDMVFVDADKTGYIGYWEAVVPRVRKGGLIVADNVLWSGNVLAPSDANAEAIAAFNDHVSGDHRVEQVILPIRDGITVATVL